MDIRLATVSDSAGIKEVHAFFAEKLPYDSPDWFWEEAIEKERILVACEEEKVVGYLIYQILWGNTPFVALIKILPEYQGKGAGRQMMERLEEILKAAGYTTLLSSSEQSNPSAHAFHQKVGFHPSGRMDGLHEDELFFRKSLQ